MQILAIPASPLPRSFARRVLDAAVMELGAGLAPQIWEGVADLPPYASGPAPRDAARLRRAIHDANGLLLVVSGPTLLPGQLRWGNPFLSGKPAAVVSVGPATCGAMWTYTELMLTLKAGHALASGAEITVSPESGLFTYLGRFADPFLRLRVSETLSTAFTPR